MDNINFNSTFLTDVSELGPIIVIIETEFGKIAIEAAKYVICKISGTNEYNYYWFSNTTEVKRSLIVNSDNYSKDTVGFIVKKDQIKIFNKQDYTEDEIKLLIELEMS